MDMTQSIVEMHSSLITKIRPVKYEVKLWLFALAGDQLKMAQSGIRCSSGHPADAEQKRAKSWKKERQNVGTENAGVLTCWYFQSELQNRVRWYVSEWRKGFQECQKLQLCVKRKCPLTLYLLTWRIWWAPNNASKGQMVFNSAFRGLMFHILEWNKAAKFGNINRDTWHKIWL